MDNFETYEDLAQLVDHNGGIVTAVMGGMRDIHGAGKLGSIVVTAIHERLESLGLGHAPVELPTNQAADHDLSERQRDRARGSGGDHGRRGERRHPEGGRRQK